MSRSVIPGGLVPDPVGPFSEIIVPSVAQRNQFLELVARGLAMHAAAARVDLPYMSFARLARADEQFQADLVIARQMRNLAAEELLYEQATVGIDEVQTHQGRIVYDYKGEYTVGDNGEWKPASTDAQRVPVTVKRLVTSNPSLIAILKANFPEKYRERSEVVNVNKDATVPDRIAGPEDRAKIIAYLNKRLAARGAPTYTPRDPDEDLL